ncbi:putative meiotic cell cortex C-terminal pleckstrin homology [Lyophyllum shimeji]|uniref:Meiotic cell cortex C-terminal pleckstrin homology n=1 Tax=Lyophyllum shimeji TaxID=47721 RepID=A0A9P3PW15_LYOSH|nr:putative meiotic cell cortex C-terminal pleckstrin homology [Lyophyllum shimeji]
MPDFSAPMAPFSSAGDMKFHLQNLLDSKEKQLQQAGTLGQRVLAQQMELEERIRQLQELEADKGDDDEIDEYARERYRELAETLVAWDNENAQLSSAFGSSKRLLNGKTPSPSIPYAELPREEPERSKPSAGTSAAQSRRAKNAAHRADDVEFAFEIGSGLLTEVRRLQSLLGERDKAIQDMKEEKDDLEKSVEALRTALRQQEQSSDKYKEENWNLEVTLQELRTQLGDSQAAALRLEGEHKRLTKHLATARDAGDQHKNEAERLTNVIEEMKAKHETDIAQARKHAAGLARDKSDLQQAVDTLKNEAAKAGRRFPRFGSPLTPNGAAGSDFLLTPAGGEDGDGDVFTGGASTNRRKLDTSAMFGEAGDFADFADSPEVSPVRPPFLAANHPSNEIEALQQRLAHAQRQINTLKGTLQREKQLRMEYRSKLEATAGGSVAADEIDEAVEEVVDEEDDGPLDSNKKRKPRTVTPFKVGGRGRGRGRGRGGASLIERLGMASSSPASEFNDGDSPHADDSPAPPVPPIPIRFSQPEEDEDSIFVSRDLEKDEVLPDEQDEPREREQSPSRSPSPMEPNSNRASVASVTSVDGMDPAFANVLRRVPSNGSTYTRSPLRQSVLSGSTRGRTVGVGRRPRGGVPYKEARPASLVEAPGVLSAELLGGMQGSPTRSQEILEEIEETYRAHEVETAEFGCQTEPEPQQPKAVAPETVDMAVQAEPEPEPVVELPSAPEPAPVVTADQAMQTDEEPKAVVETAEMGTQHAYEEPVPPPAPTPVHVDMNIGTDPEPEPVVAPVLAQAQTQTFPTQTTDADTQTTGRPALSELGMGRRVEGDISTRRTTITQSDMSIGSSSGDTTLRRSFLAYDEDGGDEDDDGEQTETGAETEPETETDMDDYHDARQSISMFTPSGTESREDFHSVMTMSDNEFSESEDDGESIKASRMTPSHNGDVSQASSVVEGGRRPSSFYAAVNSPPPEYEDVGVSADFKPEPERIIVHVPVPPPTPPPKPELKEMSIQTDEWKPPPLPPAPAPIVPPTPGLYRVGSNSNQQFQFIAPPTPVTGSSGSASAGVQASASSATIPAGASVPIPVAAPGPLSSILRESSGTFGRSRTPVADRRQSMESVISSIADELPNRSRVPSGSNTLTVVDKSKPPMMVLPPPPKAPPPPGSMPPPAFIPEKRMSSDVPHLGLPRRHRRNSFNAGSSMPPSQANLRQLPSTSSFRSAANAATYHAQHASSPQPGTLPSLTSRDRERRQFSQTSLVSERSMASPRSSISSDHFHAQQMPGPVTPNKAADTTPRANGMTTDPAIIHAITQTMIGEFLYKYTRRTIGKGHGQARHKRFFWVHPYTKTLYWSSADPGSSNVSESSAKSAYIDGVRSVLDPNPMPPGLHQYSVIVSTPQREMKFTAPTKERHDIWLNALQYLLSRPTSMNITSPGNATVVPQSPISQEYSEEDGRPHQDTSPQSQRSVRSARRADTWNVTPRGQRSRSQLSARGSVSKRSGTPAAEYLRWAGPESPYSPTKSFVDVLHHDEEDLDFELHADGMSDDGYEGLENVRACCDGKHTVGHSGKHHHHHHHHNGDRLDPSAREPVARPVSPAWSFRSRTGSAHSGEGGGTGIFSWGRGDDGKLRFGSRRSQKTVATND